MTAGPLILSTLIHGALLAAAVVASFKPSGSGDGTEVLRFFDIVQSKSDRSTGVTSAPWSGGGAITPPRLLADSGVEGEVIAEFVVLEDGMVELSTLRIVSATHEDLESATRSLLARIRFEPGRLEGEPVPVLTRLPIKLRVGV